MSHAREDDTYPRAAAPLGVGRAGASPRRRRGRRHDAARLRPPRRPPPGPPQVPRRGARHRLDPRRGRPPRPARASPPPVEQAPWTAEDHHGTARRRRSGCRCRRARSPTATACSCARRCASWSPTARSPRSASRARQDLLLYGIAAGRIAEVEDRLRGPRRPAGRRRRARCAAWPSPARRCRRAARRSARPSGCCPTSSTELEKVLADAGTATQPIRLNMTGCPNGCARPYTAEIGIVGRTKKGYDVYVGGSAAGDRLAERIRTDVPLDQIAATLAPGARPLRRAPTRRRRSATGPTPSARRRSRRGCPSPSCAAAARRAAADAEDAS